MDLVTLVVVHGCGLLDRYLPTLHYFAEYIHLEIIARKHVQFADHLCFYDFLALDAGWWLCLFLVSVAAVWV